MLKDIFCHIYGKAKCKWDKQFAGYDPKHDILCVHRSSRRSTNRSSHSYPPFIAHQLTMWGPTFSTSVVRKPEDIAVSAPQFLKDLRKTLSTEELLVLIEKATEGATSKLKTINLIKEVMSKSETSSVLTNNVEVETFIEHLEQHCVRFDMAHFMCEFPVLNPPKSDESNRFDKKVTMDLFKKWDIIGNKEKDKKKVLQNIGNAIAWLKTYTSTTSQGYLEDMEWVHLHLMNSMEPKLR